MILLKQIRQKENSSVKKVGKFMQTFVSISPIWLSDKVFYLISLTYSVFDIHASDSVRVSLVNSCAVAELRYPATNCVVGTCRE